MKKRDFKKMMRKENKAFKNYYIYEIFIIIIMAFIVIVHGFLCNNQLISPDMMLINTIGFVVLVSLPIVIIDIKNYLDIKKMYSYYLKENKIPKYNDKTKFLQIVLVFSFIATITCILRLPKYISYNSVNNVDIDNRLNFTTNKGNTIKMSYQDFGGFKIKIPVEFEIMSQEAIDIKYPNANAPSIVYTNEDASINIAISLRDSNLEDYQVEEYLKETESYLKNIYYDYEINSEINFFKQNGHMIGELAFVSKAIDTNIFNHLVVFSIDGKLKIINFNCIEDYMTEWKSVSDFIINSLIID